MGPISKSDQLTLLETRDADGNEQAKCADEWVDPEWWWDPRTVDLAKDICDSCPIKLKCLEFAIKENQIEGVWGGLSDLERRNLLKKSVTINQGKANK
jgi:WhiB family redox-sensing transcriptional regulator